MMNNQGNHGYATADVFDLETAIFGDEDHDYEWVAPLELPAVRPQRGPTCVFNAMASIVELKKKGVVLVDVDSFFTDYKKKILVPFGEDQNRVMTALKMFRDQGVIASCDGREERVKISGYQCHQGMYDYQVFDIIRSGTTFLGSFPVREDFCYMKDGIYELNPPVRDGELEPATHIVMFVGYGKRKGRTYLVFQNSYGPNWGTQGLGRAYFDQVYQLEDNEGFQLITVTVDSEVGTSLAVAEPPSPQNPPLDDKPAAVCPPSYQAEHRSSQAS